MATISNTFTTAGANNWVCPAGINWVTVECWGAGGAGAYMNASGNGGGGGGGAYAKKYNVPVVPGTTYTLVVGTGGNCQNNANGVASSFNSGVANACVAAGGTTAPRNNTTGQVGGLNNACTGDILADGGSGYSPGSGSVGGGGGSSSGPWNNGVTATGQGGAAAVPLGGAGGAGAASRPGNGTNGSAPGGAGGGGSRSTSGNRAGGNGNTGQVVVNYDPQQINNYLHSRGNTVNTGIISFTEKIR